MANEAWKDGGWKSRKLGFSIFAIAILYIGARIANADTAFRAVYESFVGGVVGISGMYLIGNVGTKWVAGKAAPAAPPTTPAPKAKADAPPEESQ